MNFEKLLELLKDYAKEDVELVKKAYNYADELHRGQFRQSGDAYITHPLQVAYILAEMHADRDTLCAALLHDTLEDTPTTKEDIAEQFNKNVANLVCGVTKLSKMNFSTKEEQNLANTRKIITGITDDVRIIIIKLADRLHNMRTLEFKSEFKQKENALETMEIFVPLAYYLGAYRIKSELEDLALRYIKPDMYKRIAERKMNIEQASKKCLEEMLIKIKSILNDNDIPYEIKIRTKNIYGIYKRLSLGDKIADIHDLLAIKIMLNEVDECYRVLGYVHSLYHPINDKFKDYICNPKTNMYQSLHTTVFGPSDRLVQTQIRTFNMDLVASYGLIAYFSLHKENVRDVMQEELKSKYQFFQSLIEINRVFADNQDFVKQVKSELFADKIYVYTTKGDILEFPKGSTVIDFAYKIHTDLGNTMVAASVNNEMVPLNYVLKNKDRVRIIKDDLSYGPRKEWEEMAYTSYAKKRIREFNKS